MRKGFYTIDHSKLLNKLHNYGIRGNTLELIKCYFSDRKQYVKVLDEESSELDVIYGVPQGSVLEPLLFLLYINDINSSSKDRLFVLFADDTNIFVSDKSRKGIFNKTRAILYKVNNYMRCNLLHINIKKCCFMYFSPNKREMRNEGVDEDDTILAIEGTIIKQVTETKFLGVTTDD